MEQEVEVEVDVEVTDSSSSAPSERAKPTSTSASARTGSTSTPAPSRVEQKFAEVVDEGSGKLRMWSESGEVLTERVARATPGVVSGSAQKFRVEVSELREQVNYTVL